MILQEIKRVLIHIRFSLQVFILMGFIFGLLIAGVPFSFKVLLALVSLLFLLSGVTVFNSYYDKDKGPVAGLRKPPKTSDSMFYGSLILKLFGLIIAFWINTLFISLYITTIILSILYSHKYFRLKSNVYTALLFNLTAGFIIFFSAAGLGNSVLTLQNVLGAITESLFMTSIYLLMQVHQIKEDKQRRDISFAVIYGRDTTIKTSFIIMLIAGILAILTFYIAELIFHLAIILLYLTIGSILIILWLNNLNRRLDYDSMSTITSYFSFTGNILLLILYFFF